MLQIAPVISKPLPAVAVNEEGRRTQQGEQEQERATQREESCPHPHREGQSSCRKGPRLRGSFVNRWADRCGSHRGVPHEPPNPGLLPLFRPNLA
jgi:hypothetical protein